MQKDFFWVPAVVLLGLFFAGGVYSQVMPPGPPEANPLVETSIQNGLGYISSSPHLDSEILILYLLSQSRPEYGLSEQLTSRTSELDEFNAPIRDFIQGNIIDAGKYSPSTLESLYYSDFISYFGCEPISSERISRLSSLSDDSSEFGQYHSAHSLLLLQLIKNDYFGGRCGNFPELLNELDSAISSKSTQIQGLLDDKTNLDAWVEKVGVLGFANQPVSPEHIQFILDQQSPDGGWRSALYNNIEDTSSHTTALAVWALVEVA